MKELKQVTILGLSYYCLNNDQFTMNEAKNNFALMEAFTLFQQLFPDHPDLENTFVHFLTGYHGIDMLWCCSHFEHNDGIEAFVKYLDYRFSQFGHASLDLFNGHGQNLIISVSAISIEPLIGLYDLSEEDEYKKFYPVIKNRDCYANKGKCPLCGQHKKIYAFSLDSDGKPDGKWCFDCMKTDRLKQWYEKGTYYKELFQID